MSYVLMQRPDEECYAGQIEIVDAQSHIGIEKICKLFKEGCKHIGYIDSELTPNQLRYGFNSYCKKEKHKIADKISKIREIIEE